MGLKVQHVRAARGQGLTINSAAPLREQGDTYLQLCLCPLAVNDLWMHGPHTGGGQKQTSLPVNSVSKAGRPFEKPAVVVGVMPTAKRALVQLSRRHAWKRTHTWNLKRQCSVAPERYMPGGGEQLPGWVAVCTAASCSCSRGRPPHLFAPANHKCGNMLRCAP